MTSALSTQSPRDDLASWAMPLVADVVWSSYRRASLSEQSLGTLARLHIIQLRHLLFNDPASAPAREALLALARKNEISEGEIMEIDSDVLAELMDVISRRFQRSPERARDCGLEVMRVACWLTAAAKAA